MSGFLCSMVGATFSVAAAAEVLRSKKGLTAVGGTQVSTAQSKFGGSSLYKTSATADYLKITDTTGLNFAGDFTIEGWFRGTSFNEFNTIYSNFDSSLNGIYFAYWNTANKFSIYINGSERLSASNTLSTNTWYHIALVRSGSTLTLYRDGTSIGTGTYSGTVLAPTFSAVGVNTDGLQQGFLGYYDELRISKTARYTTGFTPSTTPFVNDANTLLLIHANGTNATTFFEDDNGVRALQSLIAVNQTQLSTAQSQFGGSSIVFDGNDDYITVTGMPSLTGDYTLECWARFDILPWNQTLSGGAYMMLVTAGSSDYITIFRNGAGSQPQIQIATAGKYGSFTKSGQSLAINTWYHIAVVRNSGVFKVFFNGTELTTFINDSGFTNSGRTENMAFGTIGRFIDARGSWDGYIDELRVSNSARYTGDFTPPTAPFVNDANTVLLIHAEGTNASTVLRDDNGAIPAAVTTTSAVAFDGTGDYYEATSLSNSAAADSKYALIAFTFYWNGGNNLQHPVNLRLGTGSGDYGFWIWINGGRSQLKFVTGTGSNPGSIYENTENSINTNAWNQVVMWIDTTSSNTSQIWVNGNQKAYSNDGFPTGSLFNWTNTASTLKIGQKNTSQTGDGNDFNGRISQVYISAASSFPGIDKFWRQGKPLDLGTNGTATGLAQPLIYHYGGTSTFPTNQGNGFGSYTLTANGNVATSSNNSIYQTLRIPNDGRAIGNAKISTSRSKFGGSSAYFDGAGDYVISANSISFPDNQDFTWEFWVNEDISQGCKYIGGQSAGDIFIGHDGNAFSNRLGVGIVSVGWYMDFGLTLSLDTWYHICVQRSGDTVYGYVDGVLKVTTTNLNNSEWRWSNVVLGAETTGNTPFNGYLDEIRWSKTVRYATAGFTPPTASFQNDSNTVLLMHCDGTNNSTVFTDDNGIAPYIP